jgi:FtsH-binding integral membrane protein
VYWLGAAGLAAVVALAAPLPGLGAAPTAGRIWAWIALVLAGFVALFVLRRRTRRGSPAAERLAFTVALVASYLLAALLANLLLAALAALPHLLLSSRVRLRPTRDWRLVDVAIVAPGCLWSALALAAAAGVGVLGLLPAAIVAPAVGLAYLGATAPFVAALAHGRE